MTTNKCHKLNAACLMKIFIVSFCLIWSRFVIWSREERKTNLSLGSSNVYDTLSCNKKSNEQDEADDEMKEKASLDVGDKSLSQKPFN